MPCLLFQAALLSRIIQDIWQPQNAVAKGFTLSAPWPTVEAVSIANQKLGLSTGDVLLQVDGKPFQGLQSIYTAVGTRQHGDSMPIKVRQKDGTIRDLRVRLENYNIMENPLIWGSILIIMGAVTPLLSLGMGFWVAFVRPTDPLAWIFLGLTISFGHFMFSMDSFGIWPVAIAAMLVFFHALMQMTFSLFLFLFGLYFPFEWGWSVRWWWFKWIFILPLTANILLSTSANMTAFFASGDSLLITLLAKTSNLFLVVTYAGISAFFWALSEKRARSKDPDSKRRLRILFLGSFIALTPIGLDILYMLISGKQRGEVGHIAWLLCLFLLNLFPVTLAYVVVVHRAFDLKVVIRQGLQYALARGGVRFLTAILMLAVVAAATLRATTPGSRPIEVFQTFAIGIGATALILRGREKVFSWVDKQFFREAYAAEQVLSDLGESVRSIVDRKTLLETVAHRLAETLHIDRVAMMLSGDTGFRPAYALGYGLPPEVEFSSSSFTAKELAKQRTPIPVYFDDENNWVMREGLSDQERGCLQRLGSNLILPLTVKDRLLGFISLGAKKSDSPYSKSDMRLLGSVAGQMGMALENSRLTEAVAHEAAQKERLNREIEIAREVQQRFFPQNLPTVEGLDYAGYCRPALGVGGDYYDFVPLDTGQLGIAIGDVSGKGVPAALLMACLQASLRGQAVSGSTDLAKLMLNLNRQIYDSSADNRYATFFYSQYDVVTRKLEYSNGGHNTPMVVRGKELIRLDVGGPVVGLFRPARYEQANVQLERGDILIMFTDGISEAMNSADDEWGEENLAATVQKWAHLSAADMVPKLMEAADAFVDGAPQHDDMTIIVAKIL